MNTFRFFTEKKIRIICAIITVLIFMAIGFYLGRKTVNIESPHTEVIYVKGKTIVDSIPYPAPYEIIKPADTADIIRQCVRDGIYSELFPEKTITEYIEITKDDTSAIIKDWATKRLYLETLFDVDTLGKCIVNASVQYNRLSLLSYNYTPIEKQVTITTNKIKFFSPYVGLGCAVYGDFSTIETYIPTINAGFFIKENYGIEFKYGKSLKTKNKLFETSLLYKF